MREFSVPASVRVGDDDTLSDTVFALADEHPDAVALRRRVDDTWAEVTYAAFVAEIVAVARGLVASGIAPGDRVALLSRTRYEWTLFDYAIVAAGAVTVPIYETSSAEQVGVDPRRLRGEGRRRGGRAARRDGRRAGEPARARVADRSPRRTGRARSTSLTTRGGVGTRLARCTNAAGRPARTTSRR